MWVVVLCRGGHFAAAAFELRLPPKGAASRRGEECVKLLAHRCYHRYVTRRNARALPYPTLGLGYLALALALACTLALARTLTLTLTRYVTRRKAAT